MVACTKPQHRKKEESEQLRGERDKIKTLVHGNVAETKMVHCQWHTRK